MHGILRMVAVVLLIAMAAMPAAQAMPFPAVQTPHPAGCHSHGPATPSPAPASYQCCVTGHDAAIPSVARALRPLVARFAASDGGEDLALASTFAAHFSSNVVIASSPPGIAPLRI
jgi:hypothetical protein